MAVLLSKTKSTAGSPYVYYKLNYTTSNRTTTGLTINISGTANLASSSSTLGSGSSYSLTGHLTSNFFSKDFTIKSSSASWSGTTEHTFSTTITLTNLTGSQTSISNIKFSVTRGNNSTSSAGYLKSTSCNNITFEAGHESPTLNSISMVETNPTLINANISNDYFVLGLSQKQFTINANYYDDAIYDHTTIINQYGTYTGEQWSTVLNTNDINVLTTTNDILDLSTNNLSIYKDVTTTPVTQKIRLKYKIYDSLGGNTENNYTDYDYKIYSKPTINASVKRDGQTSGNVVLNASGTFYKGTIGNVTQTTPTIKYKYWEYGTTEPSTYSNTISSGITISNNTFTISNLNIGNNYNYQKAYRIKVQVSDNFTSIESPELSIAVGEATWTEYPDRVDFKKLTIKGNEVKSGWTLGGTLTGSTSESVPSGATELYFLIKAENNTNVSFPIYVPVIPTSTIRMNSGYYMNSSYQCRVSVDVSTSSFAMSYVYVNASNKLSTSKMDWYYR